MEAYAKSYLNDVVDNQGKLFDYFISTHPDCDSEDFINSYMLSKTRKAIDEGQAYVNTMDYKELLDYFLKNDNYIPKKGFGYGRIYA